MQSQILIRPNNETQLIQQLQIKCENLWDTRSKSAAQLKKLSERQGTLQERLAKSSQMAEQLHKDKQYWLHESEIVIKTSELEQKISSAQKLYQVLGFKLTELTDADETETITLHYNNCYVVIEHNQLDGSYTLLHIQPELRQHVAGTEKLLQRAFDIKSLLAKLRTLLDGVVEADTSQHTLPEEQNQ